MMHSPARRSIRPAALFIVAGLCMPLTAAAADKSAAPSVPQPWIELNGTHYHVQKVEAHGPSGVPEVIHIYSDGQRAFTWEQLSAHVAAQHPHKITSFLQNVLATAPADEPISVAIFLKNQPGEPISREVWDRIAPEREALASGMRQITRRILQRPSMPEEIERDFIPLPLTRAEMTNRRALAQALDDLERDARREIHARIGAAIAADQDEVAVRILELGGEVTARVTAVNVLGASLTPRAIELLAQSPLVAQIEFDHPGEPELDNSRHALDVQNGFWASNITGGVFDAGVLDTGVQMNHPALTTHPFLSNMGANDTGTHGTHVAGIMVSTDATHRGMAFGADKIIFALAGGITTSMPGMDYIASTGEADVCNYSFGNGSAATNDYTPTDQFFDGVISTFGYMVSKSTGNSGFGSGAPTITHPAPAFNLMAVANINDANTPTRADDWISSTSSRGPTAGGRKKPDIAAPGTNIMSANRNWATAAHFVNMSGTSMAAPHVGGAILLLYDLGVNTTTAGKAILINTADATEDSNTNATGDDFRVDGSRWNRRYGWGYMHLGKAFLAGLDYFEGGVRTTTPRERFRLYSGQMFQNEKATLVWRRHVAYNGSTYPTQITALSDLDLFAYREGTDALLASSTSAIDNVEQLSVPSSGQTVLKVKAIGSFAQNIQEERFALATQENFFERTGPDFGINIIVPAGVDPAAPFVVRADITNIGDLAAHNIVATLIGPAIQGGGSNQVNLGALAVNGGTIAEWNAVAAATTGQHPITIIVSSTSYGEVFTRDRAGHYVVGACYANCDGSTAPPILNIDDFTCFINQYAAASALPHQQQLAHYANCDGSTTAPVINIDDFACFINSFALGCP